jgi:murein L,D-transpeptidase YafK
MIWSTLFRVPFRHKDKKSFKKGAAGEFWRRSFFIVIAFALFSVTSCSTHKPREIKITGPIDKVVVKKSERKLELYSRGQVVRQYHVALGGSPIGHKYREGDQRTPEGNYTLNWRKPNSQFYKAIHVSYPNARDQENSRQSGYKPGGMIMVHGMPNYIQSEGIKKQYAIRDWTHGCIAVQNHEIDEIWNLVPDGTPIQIVP